MPIPLTDIKRYPYIKDDLLQGHDAADELLLAHMSGLDLANKKILIVNDGFGALSCNLEADTYTDSYVSFMGILTNSGNKISALNDLKKLQGPYDYVLIQLPKNMSFFEDILCHVTKHLHPLSKVICTGMVKHMAPMSFQLLEKYIGQTSTGLAKKKARLIFAHFQKVPVNSPYPKTLTVEGFETPFVNHSNLFSREKLDIGTRFFLEHIPTGPFDRILDLGCANGVIGIQAKKQNPKAKILFSDESQMAIESAKANYHKMCPGEWAEFFWANCFEKQPKDFLDLVLCNPPFHQQNTIGDFIAMQMFQDAHASLKKGGTMRVIGNSHLAYQVKLKKIFGNSKIIATNNKFMICEAVKSSSLSQLP